MAVIEMVMPKMGESIMEGTILNWLKKEGDLIEQDESVLEVATDKVDTEVPATHAGVLQKILAEVGQVVEVGKPIALIATGADAQNGTPANAPAAPEATAPSHAQVLEQQINTLKEDHNTQRLTQPATGRFYSPLVLTIAREEGISMQELEYIPGTGGDNRVTKKDILNYVSKRSMNGNGQSVAPAVAEPVAAEPAARPVAERAAQPVAFREAPPQPVQRQEPPVQRQEPVRTAPPPPVPEEQPPAYVPSVPAKPVAAPAVSFGGRSEIVEMDRMRKMIAQRMVDSKRTSPHVTSFVEADVTNIVFWRNRIKNEFKAREGDTITYTPVFIEAITKAIKDYPMINVSVDGDKIIVKKDINIGMAVALPSGNLIVPVIKGADQLNMVGLTRKVNDLARRARENKLTPDDLTEGTYTMSNVGSFGNVMGTPIIVQPQVGIMAFGAIQKKPAVIETPFGDTLGIRHMMFLSHSYDHRVVDGALGGMFVRRVADYLEGFDVNRKVF